MLLRERSKEDVGLDSLFKKGFFMSKNKYERKVIHEGLEESDRITYEYFFELIYMRHHYFKKSKNPEPERLMEFEEMICNMSSKFFFKYQNFFNQMGFEFEDIKNISRVHAVSFISLSGLKENPEKMKDFIKMHKKKYGKNSMPNSKDIFKKECYNLSCFLKQRYQELIRFSKSKIKNIRGTVDVKKFFIGDPKKNPTDLELIEDCERHGYKKITKERYEKILKETQPVNKKSFLDKNKKCVRAAYVYGKNLSYEDIKYTKLDPRNNSYYGNPEDTLIDMEEKEEKLTKALDILYKM